MYLEIVRNAAGRPTGRLLRGEDDGHPFAVRVPLRCTTTEEAIDWLRPDGVRPDAPRQGDLWFVLSGRPSLGYEETGRYSWREAKGEKEWNVSIGGTRHIAEELLTIWTRGSTAFLGRDGVASHRWEGRPRLYVRGRITHPEHGTLVLHEWHRVVPRRGATINRYGLIVAGDAD